MTTHVAPQSGLDVTLRKIPQKDRHLAIASGDIQCAATTVETWVVWNANGVATTLDADAFGDSRDVEEKLVSGTGHDDK